MLSDDKAGRMFALVHQGVPVAQIAKTLEMGERTIRKYRDQGILPSQQPKPKRTYRTRIDPLEAYWPEIEAFLEADPRLKPVALLDWLKEKYNDPETGEGPVSDSIRRTLERRVQKWKLDHQVSQEVTFPQVHHAGDVIAFDFVNLNALGVTIGGRAYDHLLFHAVFTYSNWEYVHLCHSESFEALSAGLQDALHLAGGVPQRVRSDSLSAAVNNLSSDKQFARQYQALLDHYGVKGHRINVRKPQENGDVESAHGHLKTWLDQKLRLRGHRDFESVEAYRDFFRQVVTRKNTSRAIEFQREFAALKPLPAQRLASTTCAPVRVKSDCVLRIKRNLYSVSSQYIGLKLDVLIHQDHLELWHQGHCLERLPRLFGQGKEHIDFRHVIDSLVRKPGAFLNYKYANHLYPTLQFRLAYDQLVDRNEEKSAIKQYLKILHAAKHEGLDQVDDVLRYCFSQGLAIQAERVLGLVKSRQQLPSPLEVDIKPPDLSLFDSLLSHQEAFDEKETVPQNDKDSDDENGPAPGGFPSDRYVPPFGPTERTPAADVSGTVSEGGRASGTGELDASAIPRGTDPAGMPGPPSEPHRTPPKKFETAHGENLGAISMVPASAAYHATIRDAQERQFLGPAQQLADFRRARFGEDESFVCIGRPTRPARPDGLVHNLPTARAGVASSQTRSAVGEVDQETQPVRGVDHRRFGLCPTEPRGDGSAVHADGRALRAGEPADQQQPALFGMGANLPRPDDHSRGHRPLDPPLDHHRVEHSQLPLGNGQEKQEKASRFGRLKTWFQKLGQINLNLFHSQCN